MDKAFSYQLKLLRIHCYVSDESDADEVYLMLNDNKIWPSGKFIKMKESSEELDVEFKIEKGSKQVIQIMDHDFVSSNDLLGTITIDTNSSGGPFTSEMKNNAGSNSKYSLEYEIL